MGRPKKNKKIMTIHPDFISAISKELKREKSVTIFGMGDFVIREMKQRYYFNPKTGETKRKRRDIKIVFIANSQFKNLCSRKI